MCTLVLTKGDDASHEPVDLHRLGVVVANTKLHHLGGLHDLHLINEGPHGDLQEVQGGHEEAKLGGLVAMLIQGELPDVHEQPKLPVLK